MADLQSLLAVLENDPDDPQARDALPGIASQTPPEARASQLAATRKVLTQRGRPDVVSLLLEAELACTTDVDRKADLLLEHGMVLEGELLDVAAARAAFEQVLALRPGDTLAREALDELAVAANNWTKFADKYVQEASASTDRGLATGLYVSAAEAHVRFAPDGGEAEAHLRRALEIDGSNAKAAFHLARLLRRQERWTDLAALLEARVQGGASVEEKVASSIALADLSRTKLGAPDRADAVIRQVLELDPAQPQALRAVTDVLVANQDWDGMVRAYQAALKARRDEDLGMLLQIAMVLWKHVGDVEEAESYFARVRKLDPAHPAALDFYRAYYPAKGENHKLLALLRQAEKVARPRRESNPQALTIGREIAELAEAQHNPEKAIEAWKQLLRHDPASSEARAALARLYRKTEKWNALLDLMKEEIDRLPEEDVAGRVERLHQIVEIYRDKLRLDVMVINTYNAILKIDPENQRATDELAAKFRALGRWNDLIAILTKKSEAPDVPDDARVAILREVAELWSERFGNYANAVKPLERILELVHGDRDTIDKLKEIYTKRRQWRALIDVLGREASVLPPTEKRAKQLEMARLAAERLGDTRLAIELLNGMLADDRKAGAGEGAEVDDPEILAALASLYEREKRYVALAEILHRQRQALDGREAIALLEKLGQIYNDRLGSPAAAAKAWQEVLDLEPNHAKALRTLRELYATAGDFAGLEKLYARLGQESELVEALLGIADRLDDRARRLPLIERAAQLAQAHADAVTEEDGGRALERARQVWERVLAVEPTHVGAAAALAPIYTKQEKWARLITVLEIELGAAVEPSARLAKIAQIREICEQKLASRTLAFTWTLRAFDLDPTSTTLRADLLRLASEPDHWREIAATFDRHLDGGQLPDALGLELYRELARIAVRRLGDPERARAYHRAVLGLAPDDKVAEQQLEELSIQLADWPGLLALYQRRVDREQDPDQRASLLLDMAQLQEERLVDLDAAAATYRRVLEVAPAQLRAIRALARIEEARGNWEALADVLGRQLELTPDGAPRFDLLIRLGMLDEQTLDRPVTALAHYRTALAIEVDAVQRAKVIAALVRFLPVDGPGGKVPPAERVGAARLALPHLEAARNVGLQAVALEVIRAGDDTSPAERLAIDRALMRLYHAELEDPAAAWSSGLRVLEAEPGDAEARAALGVLAGQLGRDGEWAQHLGVALGALRERDGAPAEVRAVATELAIFAWDRLSDRATSERAWLAVLEVESDASDAFDALAELYRTDARWEELRALLERRVGATADDRVRLAALLAIAALDEDVLAQPARAAEAHRRALELDPAHLPSYQALDRLYTAGEQWTELEGLLARQDDHLPSRSGELVHRRAELFAKRLGDPTRAVDLLEDLLARHPSHPDARELLEELMRPGADPAIALRIARILEPLYERDGLWKDLVAVLHVQRAQATGTEAVELLARIAQLEETELSGARTAFETWIEVLRLDPTHERARVEIARLARDLDRWPDATAALEAAADAAPEDDVITRAALLGELAAYYDTQLGESARAIAAYRRWLEVDGSNPTTVRRSTTALARLYEEARAWPELRSILRTQAEWAEEPAERRALLARVAVLEEEQLVDRSAAIATWRDVLADLPADTGALDALERLYQAGEQWRELIDVLQRKHDQADADAAKQLLVRIAEIHEVMLEEPEEAIAAYLDILDRDADDALALEELARLYRQAERHADLLDVLERQASIDPVRQLALTVEIARLLSGPLARPLEALERWKAVLVAEPEHPQAIAALEAALDDPDLRLIAAEILRPVYGATAQYARLAQLQLKTVDWADDPGAKLRALGEVVRLREHQLADKPGAFAALLSALRHAATEPELPDVLANVERLAGELGREADLIDVYREVAPNVLDSEIQRRLYLDIADLARAVRRDSSLAGEYYQRVLDAQPDDRRALIALEAIYRDTNDDERLTEILLRQADAATADVDDRVGALVEAAGLYVQLGRVEDAIATWDQVLAIAPERRDAVEALENLYREQGRWPDVVDLYERRLGFATSIDEAVGLRVELGEIHERHLHDVAEAIDNYSAALSGDPRNPRALAALERFLLDPELRGMAAEVLEPIYIGQQMWPELVRVYEAKLESAADPDERARITRFVARLHEEQLEDFESASRWYARVFREAPGDPAVRDQLQRLASIVENWELVAQTYQEFLDGDDGDMQAQRDVALAVATIYERRLGEPDRAYAAYRRALAIQIDDAVPGEREVLRRVEELLWRTEKWTELAATYEDVIARADDDLRREVLVKRAHLLEDKLGDVPRAIDGWREVLLVTEGADTPAVERAYREAVSELERLYRQGSQWPELVDLFEGRLARSQQPAETAELRLRLAELLETHVEDLGAAIDQLEHVIAEGALWERAVQSLERLVVHEQHRERITELLEPVYREQDWWQKLVVILDAKLDYVRDPIEQTTTLHEIARIHEERGGALDLALEALARAWRLDVTDDESLRKLLALASRLGAWNEAVSTLEEGAAAAPSPDLAAGLWARAAEIHEAQRADLPAAIRAWRKVEEARPDDVVALAALDRLLAVEGRVQELVTVIARRAELAEDAGVRLVLLHRAATLHEEVLNDAPAAIAAYRSVLEVDDTDLAALDALERLYRAALATGTTDAREHARELAVTLERKIELTADVAARQALRHAAAAVYERELDDIYQAIGQLTGILDDDAAEPVALAELDRIYSHQKLWPELLEVLDRRALIANTVEERADLGFRGAHLVETELVDVEGAIARYGAVLQVLPGHARARAALEVLMQDDRHVEAVTPILERVYRADRDVAGLVRVYERRLAVPADDPEARRADWAALAEVHELLANQPALAFQVWARAIAAEPEDAELLSPLVRLAEAQPSLWAELAACLDRLLAGDAGAALSPEVEQIYTLRLGEIAEDKLADLDRAAAAYERASQGPEPRTALAALERVLARAGRWPELAGVLRREAEAADDDAKAAEYQYRLGDLEESTLEDPGAAVAAYREALQLVPAHPQARAALERLLASAPDQCAHIVEVLEPLFEQDGDAARLANVLEARLAITADPLDRASLLARILELAEQRLGDRARALDAALRWLALDPASEQALGEVDRLAERLGQWHEVGSRVAAIVHAEDASTRDADVQVALLVFLGRIQRERLGQLDEAAASYRAALVLEPESLLALDELIRILRQRRDDHGALADALRQRGRIAPEVADRRAAYAEVAELCERAGDRAGAIAAWREAAELDDQDRAALDELARLYRETENHVELVDVLTRATRLATSADDEKALRVEIARLESEGPRAVSAWQAVLDLDADDGAALSALEAAYARAGDWIAVADVQMRRLSLARTTADKVAIQAEIAKLAEDKRDAIDDAIASWYAVIDLDPSHQPAYDQLDRLLTKAARPHDLVELLEKRAELYAALGDGAAEIAALARAADVWEGQLDDPDAAGEILEKILRREPGSVAALTRLSKIYERAGDWERCKATLEQALQLVSSGPSGRDGADLFFRLGEVARNGDGDAETAILHYQQALKQDPGHAPAIAELEKLARDRGDTSMLADLLARRVALVTEPAARVALLVELAELERTAGRADAALDALSRAAADAPNDTRVLAPLADLYFAASRLDEAAPIYDRLAQEAKAARRMKDVARFRQRQGGILEKRGDTAGALAAYEEALRINPTDVATMTGLGRLYLDSGDWEKARRIYQSLVLQNLGAEAGVSKGDVYWALGTIHLQLGQPPKARSMFQRGLELEPQNQKLKDALSSLA